MHKTVAFVDVLFKGRDVGYWVDWVPSRKSLPGNARAGQVFIHLVIEHQINLVARITVLLDVECKAKARPVRSVGVVWVAHVVLDVFKSDKLFKRIRLVAAFEISLALEDNFKLRDDA